MDYLIIGVAVVVIVILLRIIYKYSQAQKEKKLKNRNLKPVKCPVCNSSLYVGENLISKVFRPMKVPDQLMVISGCPHCFPRCEPGVKRTCPVCHKEVGPDENLTARLFNKSVGKKHVHIIGCSKCHRPRAQ